MYLHDFLTVATVQFLRLPESEFKHVLEHFRLENPDLELELPKKFHAQSVCMRKSDGELQSYVDWIRDLRKSKAELVLISEMAVNHPLPRQIREAFMNATSESLFFSRGDALEVYTLKYLNSPESWITGAELERILDTQFTTSELNNGIWREVLEGVIAYKNGYIRSESLDDARKYLREDFEKRSAVADEILKCAQAFCRRQGVTLKIPEDLKTKLTMHVGEPGRFEKKPKPPTLIASLTGKDMADLIEAQENPGLWKYFLEILNGIKSMIPDLKTFDEILSAEEANSFLSAFTDEQAKAFPKDIYLELLGEQYKIPSHLKPKFSIPDFTPSPAREVWNTKPNPDWWRMLSFELVSQFDSGAKEIPRPDLAEAEKQFMTALKAAEEFTRSGGFHKSFSTALRIMTDPGFTVKNKEDFTVFSLQRVFNFSDKKVRGLLACDYSNVFGGMGSWNDQNGGYGSDVVSNDFSKALFHYRRVLVGTP